MSELAKPFDLSLLPETDENFHFLAYSAHILLWMCGPDGACEFVSPSWQEFTGREPGEELGSGWLGRVHPEDLSVLRGALDDAIAGRHAFRLLFRYRRQDDVYRWFVALGMVRTLPGGEYAGHIAQCFDVTSYQAGEAEVEQAAQRMIFLLKQTRLIAVVLDNEGRVLFSNGSLCRLMKQGGGELLNRALFQVHLAPSSEALRKDLYPDDSGRVRFPPEFESDLINGAGEVRQLRWHSISVQGYCGHPNATILIGDDLTDARRAEDQVRLTASVFESTGQAMVITDTSAKIIAVNQAFSHLTGYSREEALGQNPSILQSGRHDAAFYEAMWKSINDTGHWRGDVWDRRRDGSIYPKFLSISVIRNAAGHIANYVGIFYEISERKAMEERLDFLAHYDTLTGLTNRCLLLDRLTLSVERALRARTKVGVLYLDLDHFKDINDTFGHAAGDRLLQIISRRLMQCVRAADTVARLGGDEFVVLLPDIKKQGAAAQVAKKILAAVSEPVEINGTTHAITPSIGICIYPDDNEDVEVLINLADRAMYEAKLSGRGNFKFFREIGKDGQAK